MQYQLEFWPTTEVVLHKHEPWENLGINEQAERIALLARLIAKAVCPERDDATQESSHEQ